MKKGLVIRVLSDIYEVLHEGTVYNLKARGNVRSFGKILVGDNVIFDKDLLIIESITPRKNTLRRPSICNVNTGIIVTCVKNPDFDSNLLDKILMILEYEQIDIVIIFTKLDLLDKEELYNMETIMNYYKNIGYKVFKNTDINNIKNVFKDKVSVLIGQSGVGKSSLLNRLDINLELETNEISKALNRGKHTTRHTSLINIHGGFIADSPGFSALDIELDKESIKDNFIELYKYSIDCKYKNCMHLSNSDGCNIRKLVDEGIILESRYKNYLKFIEGK